MYVYINIHVYIYDFIHVYMYLIILPHALAIHATNIIGVYCSVSQYNRRVNCQINYLYTLETVYATQVQSIRLDRSCFSKGRNSFFAKRDLHIHPEPYICEAY